MKDVKREIALHSFYDRSGIEGYLEKQAAKGWLLDEASTLVWRFVRIEPCDLRFAVTYFPDAKMLEKEARSLAVAIMKGKKLSAAREAQTSTPRRPRMKLITFAKKEGVATVAIDRFFGSDDGSRFADSDTKAFSKLYDDFKSAVARHANELFGEDRLALYAGVSDLVTALREKGLTTKEYSLKNSFLSDDEVNLIILKALHRPMSQEELASDVLKCSRNAVNSRVRALQDGVRIGDISVQLELEYGGRLESTVHPIMLPLNLSEVYALIVTLKQEAASREKADPRGVIVNDIAEKAYSQLTPYAVSRISESLEKAGVSMRGGVVPRFRGDDAKPSRWHYFEKAGVRTRVTHVGPDGEAVEHEGTIIPELRNRHRQDPLLLSDDDPESAPPSQPQLTLKLDDGSLIKIRWSDVIDIQQAE